MEPVIWSDPTVLMCPVRHRKMAIISAESTAIDLKILFKCFRCEEESQSFLEHVLHLPRGTNPPTGV